MYELKDYLNSINYSKEPLLDSEDTEWTKKYAPFIINKCVSMHYDTVMNANEMNGYHFLPKTMQFHYLINSIRKKKRFGGKWLSQAKLKDMDIVKEYYGYSDAKAEAISDMIGDDDIKEMQAYLSKGGKTR